MEKGVPVRVFACGHRRPEAISYELAKRLNTRPRYQKVGEYGYCRRCMKERKIIAIE